MLSEPQDVSFSSPSAAAAVVGGNHGGPMVWKTRDCGQTYRDWQMEKLKQAGVKVSKS
jgi:hypothetical protein